MKPTRQRFSLLTNLQLIASLRRPLLSTPIITSIITLVGLCFLFSSAVSHAEPGTGKDAGEKGVKLQHLRQEIKQTRALLSSARHEKLTLKNQLKIAEQEISSFNHTLRKLKKNLRQQRNTLSRLKKQQSEHHQQLKIQRKQLGAQIRANYIAGRQGQLRLLLDQQQPTANGRVLVYYDYLNQASSEDISTIQGKLAKLHDIETSVKQHTKDISQTLSERRKIRRKLQGERQQRTNILNNLSADINKRDHQLSQLISDKNHLLSLITKIQSNQTKAPVKKIKNTAFKSLKGKLTLPTKGSISIRYGSSRKLGNLKWQGIVVKSPPGKDVRAIYHGRIAFTGWLRNFGIMTIIDHGEGYMSLYGYNQSLFKEVGDWVEKGEVIASVGDSGGQQLSGLYLEIRHLGTPINPTPWFRR